MFHTHTHLPPSLTATYSGAQWRQEGPLDSARCYCSHLEVRAHDKTPPKLTGIWDTQFLKQRAFTMTPGVTQGSLQCVWHWPGSQGHWDPIWLTQSCSTGPGTPVWALGLNRFSHVQLFATLWTNHSLPGSPVHGILQARILEGVAMPSSWGSPQPKDRTPASSAFQVDSLPLNH